MSEEVGTKNKNILVPSNNDTGYLDGMPSTFSVNTRVFTPKRGSRVHRHFGTLFRFAL